MAKTLLDQLVLGMRQIPDVGQGAGQKNVATKFFWIFSANENPAITRLGTHGSMLKDGPRRTVIEALVILCVKRINPGGKMQRCYLLFGKQLNVARRIWWRPILRHAKAIMRTRTLEHRQKNGG
jgi:hypothetical protein